MPIYIGGGKTNDKYFRNVALSSCQCKVKLICSRQRCDSFIRVVISWGYVHKHKSFCVTTWEKNNKENDEAQFSFGYGEWGMIGFALLRCVIKKSGAFISTYQMTKAFSRPSSKLLVFTLNSYWLPVIIPWL